MVSRRDRSLGPPWWSDISLKSSPPPSTLLLQSSFPHFLVDPKVTGPVRHTSHPCDSSTLRQEINYSPDSGYLRVLTTTSLPYYDPNLVHPCVSDLTTQRSGPYSSYHSFYVPNNPKNIYNTNTSTNVLNVTKTRQFRPYFTLTNLPGLRSRSVREK